MPSTVEIATPIEQINLLGAEQYAAPEYFLSDAGTSRSDIFSLGVIVYQMLSGKLPYGAAVPRTRTRAAQRKLAYTSVLNDEREIPAWVDDAIRTVRDRGLEVIDDVADDVPEEVVDHSGAMTTDLVRQYLNDAGRHSLLTKEDEADLAKRYQAGLAADAMLATRDDLTRTKKARLKMISRDGARAKERMVQANLRLVVPQARKFSGRDLDFIELIQEGNLGLLRAVEKFDHTKGYKFSTYAVWWIRQALQRGVASKGRTIRVPAHVWELYGKLRAAELRLRQAKGGDPTDAEVAEEVGLTAERVREVRDAMQELVSLDRPIGEDGDATMGDLIPDAAVVDPADTALEGDAVVAGASSLQIESPRKIEVKIAVFQTQRADLQGILLDLSLEL